MHAFQKFTGVRSVGRFVKELSESTPERVEAMARRYYNLFVPMQGRCAIIIQGEDDALFLVPIGGRKANEAGWRWSQYDHMHPNGPSSIGLSYRVGENNASKSLTVH